ncbi:APC family permease [Sphingobacterium paludis]|uniref:Amino acid/polyamine/organocation transporter (APC superfamily) n=1 Tax=Sphingobacterium paludis TaxID=1476465 RepID=A0A4R7DB00_9SPHI|nr:amino acid permease [Sphingobacterium paludis]TDS17295.1 amino acid/polyamine/organocation transporter (APC superfamily) [Sphingobacterium paludis]
MKRQLTLWDAIMIVMGSMIGSGIFIVSSDMMRQLGSGYWLFTVWILTAVATVSAAICYGELSSMYPRAGGQYAYLKEIFGRMTGFLYGWSLFAVIQTGTIAAVAVAFGKFAGYIFPALNDAAPIYQHGTFMITWMQIVAIGVILLLTYINTRGLHSGKLVQSIFTAAKIIALVALVFGGINLMQKSLFAENMQFGWSAFQHTGEGGGWNAIDGTTLLGGIAAAMVGAIFSSVAWENVTFISGEVKNPERNIVRAMVIGTSLVMLLYLLCNYVYTATLTRDEIAFAANDRVAIAAAEKLLGKHGTLAMALLVMVSTFGCVNGLVLSGARVFQTMAKDRLFLKQVIPNNSRDVPARSLWLQGAWASMLCLSGQYGNLLDMVSFVIVIFYMITVFGVVYQRWKAPKMDRPYKTFLYPLPIFIYLLIGILFCGLLIVYKGEYTWPGFILVLVGIPIYYVFNRKAHV